MRAARWLVRRAAPPEWRESIAGDLEEERLRRQAGGRPAGELWALAAALGAVGELWLESLRGGTMKANRGAIVGGLASDLRVTVRSLCWSPGFTFAALAVLTIGIGAAIAMFAIVHAIVLRPLPFDEPERLVAIGEVHHRLAAPGLSNLGSVAAPNFFDWQEALTSVDLAASTSASGFTIRDTGEPEELRALRATASLFDARPASADGDVQEPDVAGAQAIDDVLTRLRVVPGVEAVAALSGGVPFSGSWSSSALTLAGTTFDDPNDRVQVRSVTPDYAKVTRAEVRRGRYVSEADVAGAPAVVILNEEAVRRFFGEQDPVGAVVQLRDAPRIVVGVVGDVRVRGPEEPVSPEAYIPWAQMPGPGANVLVRTAGDPTRLAQDVSRIVLDVVPGVPVVPSALESQVQRMVAPRELNMLLTSLFGALAVVIAAVGIHGVMAYTVAQQQQEIGVRIALGASPQNIMRMVLGRATLLVAAGLVLGGGGASILAGSIRAFLFEVEPYDPAVFVSVGIVIAIAGLAAAWIPARRAARIDPIVAMQRP